MQNLIEPLADVPRTYFIAHRPFRSVYGYIEKMPRLMPNDCVIAVYAEPSDYYRALLEHLDMVDVMRTDPHHTPWVTETEVCNLFGCDTPEELTEMLRDEGVDGEDAIAAIIDGVA